MTERPKRTDLELAKIGHGTWVPDSKMGPLANIANRVCRRRSGAIGVYVVHHTPQPSNDPVESWFYPERENTDD